MKKQFALLLTLALVLGLSTTAFAAETDKIETQKGTATADVKATYVAGQSGGTVYSVDVAWEGLTFTYNGASTGAWDPATHTYNGTTAAGWATSNGTITVTNHSNAAIKVNLSYTANEGFDDVSMTFDNNNFNVGNADSGANGAAGQAKSFTAKVTPAGTLPDTTTTETVIGTITVTIE